MTNARNDIDEIRTGRCFGKIPSEFFHCEKNNYDECRTEKEIIFLCDHIAMILMMIKAEWNKEKQTRRLKRRTRYILLIFSFDCYTTFFILYNFQIFQHK